MNITRLKYYSSLLLNGLFNSYSQVYFSNSRILAFVLLAVSFFDLGAGLAGVTAVFISQLTALLFNFDHRYIRDGTYTYNSAMAGIAMGMFFQFNLSLLVLLFIASVLTVFLTIWFLNHLAAKGLPFLSIPFLVTIWLIILGAKNFSALELYEKKTLSLAYHFPQLFSAPTELISHLPHADVLYLYFRSLGAIFFQYYDLAGIIIALGILFYSRISFVLSVYGFLLGYLFYSFMQADFSNLIYSYIGFNFVLTAIALGGFFIVASRRSFILLLFCIPVIALIISGLHNVFTAFGLPLYSLPFNIVVLIALYALAQRSYASKLHKVTVQYFSPEKNHYKFFNNIERFSSETYIHIGLPFMGEWNVSQGHNGKITHKDEYRFAWDFDVRDEKGRTFKEPGFDMKDYYCYGLPVLAPAAGVVTAIIDGIDDNLVGQVDLGNNWGNTIIIKHSEYLYSKLSHLKKESFEVKQGDYVYKGQVIGYCGSSGRSPEPHLHFQLQTTPYVGSGSIRFPLSYYLALEGKEPRFHTFDIPQEGQTVSNISTSKLLTDTFGFIPGRILTWEVLRGSEKQEVKWEVMVSSANQSYLYCHTTKAAAYFVNNGTVFYFTDYYGKRNTLLHHFYTGAHRILLGYYPGIQVNDIMSITDMFPPLLKGMHDLTAPFFHYLRSHYMLSFTGADNANHPSAISFATNCSGKLFNKEIIRYSYDFELTGDAAASIRFRSREKSFEAVLCKNG